MHFIYSYLPAAPLAVKIITTLLKVTWILINGRLRWDFKNFLLFLILYYPIHVSILIDWLIDVGLDVRITTAAIWLWIKQILTPNLTYNVAFVRPPNKWLYRHKCFCLNLVVLLPQRPSRLCRQNSMSDLHEGEVCVKGRELRYASHKHSARGIYQTYGGLLLMFTQAMHRD